MKKKLSIGLFGFGCVGTGLYRVLNQTALLDAEIRKIVVKNPGKERPIDSKWFGYDKYEILDDAEINVVVELIDDAEAAFEIVSESLKRGKHVVSANKKLIANHLEELIRLAQTNNVSFLYEAAVAGSIPIIRNLEEYYNNDSLSSVSGIVNGTTNYILTKTSQGALFADALADAQHAGFAESDPTSDVDGFDAKYKLVLLLKHAFGYSAEVNAVWNYGIRNLQSWDASYAREKGLKIKLLAFGAKKDNEVIGFVAPHLIGPSHFAYNVEDEFNAVVVEALFSDRQLFLGKGAGSFPTASAVLSDISALQFDYAYEYRKSQEAGQLEFCTDFRLKVYVSATSENALQKLQFEEVYESFTGQSHSYRIGLVKFSELTAIDWNAESQLFLAVLPDGITRENRVYSETENLETAFV